MTDGEKMVWAAVFAGKFLEEHEKRRKFGDAYKVSVAECAEWARSAVIDLVNEEPEVAEGWGENHGVTILLREMLR